MSDHITPKHLETFSIKFEKNPTNKVLQNIISKNAIDELAINRDQVSSSHETFSKQVEPHVKVTNQNKAGTCWLYAGLNLLRREVIKKYNLELDFELSQSHLLFFHKLECLNYNLESIITTFDLDVNDRLINRIMTDPADDGGQWSMFINLVRKYGVVPKSVFNDTYHSTNSWSMTDMLIRKFKETALKIRETLHRGKIYQARLQRDDEEFKSLNAERLNDVRMYKENFNKFAYDSLRKMLGTPPTNFLWEYIDKDKRHHCVNVASPQKFFLDHVTFNLDDYMCLIHDPRAGHKYYKIYTVEYLNNMSDGDTIKYLNVPMLDMKAVTLESLKCDEVVWFGCDVGKQKNGKIMSYDIKQYGELFGTTFSMNKADRLNSGDSAMNHAMIFSGYNAVDAYIYKDNPAHDFQTITRWEVENSWGKKECEDGYYTLSNDWFNEYVFEVIINKKYATNKMLKSYKDDGNIITLPIWDPFGSLAIRD